MLDEVALSPVRRCNAVARIRAARQPMVEALRIVARARRDGVLDRVEVEAVDLSSVQELRVQLIRRDGVIDEPQAMYLARMDAIIAAGEMDAARFEEMAATVMGMLCALPRNLR